MIQKAISLRKKHRYKPNIIIVSGCQFLTAFFLCLLLGGYSRSGKTSFSISNYSATDERIQCLIMINQDTILNQAMESNTVYHFSKDLPIGKYQLTVFNPLKGVLHLDTLLVRDQYHDEHVYIKYQYLSAIEAIGKNINTHGHDYQKLAKQDLFQPINRSFAIDYYHSHFFSFLWEVSY
jgi:hypothetical protein